jgi:hypothetical protein
MDNGKIFPRLVELHYTFLVKVCVRQTGFTQPDGAGLQLTGFGLQVIHGEIFPSSFPKSSTSGICSTSL